MTIQLIQIDGTVAFGAPFSLTTPLGIKREAKLSFKLMDSKSHSESTEKVQTI